MKFVERIKGLFTSPDKTMEDVAKDPRLEEAVIIVAIYAVVAAISGYITSSHLKYVSTDTTGVDISGFLSIITIVTSLIAPFIMWVLISVVLYLFSMVFGGEGKFTSVLSAIGMSTIAKIFPAIVGLLLLTQAPYITAEFSSTNTQGIVDAALEFSKDPFVILSSLVTLFGLLWSSLIGVFGIKHTEKISMTSAAIVVGVPLAVYIIIQYVPMLLNLL